MVTRKSGKTRRPRDKEKNSRKSPTLTLKECRLIAAIPETGSLYEAGLQAGYSPKHIHQGTHQAIQNIRRKMPDLLEDLGITPQEVIEKHLVPLMNAEEVKFIQNDTKFVRLADNATRLRALHMYFLLAGAYTPKEQITQSNNTVRAIILDAPRPRLPDSKNGDAK